MKISKLMSLLLFSIGLFLLQSCASTPIVKQRSIAQIDSNFCSGTVSDILKQSDKRSFLYENLLKSTHLKDGVIIPIDDLDQTKLTQIRAFFKKKILNESTLLKDRFALLREFPIGDISAAPGHRYLRKPEQIKGLVDYISKNPHADFGGDKIILNVISDENGKVSSIDLWNAHHRLVAYLENGYVNIGDIPERNIEILVNGVRENGESWTHYLPAAGVDWREVSQYSVVPAGGDIREGTIALSGKFSNYRLGARNTIAQLHENVFNMNRKKMKVGVYFGTFDPVHEGHIHTVKRAIDILGLDEVIIVPNVNPIHKHPTGIEHRNSMIELRIRDEEKVNLYTGDSDEIIDRFGRNPFFERMIQVYGSADLFQIIGDDSFVKLIQEGEVERSNFRKYIVFKRKYSDSPIAASEKAIIIESEDEKGLSSTSIRNKIKAGEDPAEDISPQQFQYILEHNLYKDD